MTTRTDIKRWFDRLGVGQQTAVIMSIIVSGISAFVVVMTLLILWSLQGTYTQRDCQADFARTYLENGGYTLDEAKFLSTFHC